MFRNLSRVSAVAIGCLAFVALPVAMADANGNDTCATAEDFGGNGSQIGSLDLAAGDGKDFYRRWIEAGDSIHVRMEPLNTGNNFNLVLYYPTCVIADFNYEPDDNVEDVSFTATTSGYWLSEVWVQFGSGFYELTWTVTSQPDPCEPTEADPSSYNAIFSPDGRIFYVEERGAGGAIPGSGFLLADGTWVYEETNGLTGLQRGGIGLLGSDFPPPPSPEIINGEDPINDETCGWGPDNIIVGLELAI